MSKKDPKLKVLKTGLSVPAACQLSAFLSSPLSERQFHVPSHSSHKPHVPLDSPSYVAYPNKEMQILKALHLTYIQDLTTTHHLIAPPLLWESMTFHLHCCLLSVPLLPVLRFYDTFPMKQPQWPYKADVRSCHSCAKNSVIPQPRVRFRAFPQSQYTTWFGLRLLLRLCSVWCFPGSFPPSSSENIQDMSLSQKRDICDSLCCVWCHPR